MLDANGRIDDRSSFGSSRAHVRASERRRVVLGRLALLVTVASLGACALFEPPFAFNNPNDPELEWVPAGSFGRGFGSEGDGIPGVDCSEVSPDGSFVAAGSGYGAVVWIIDTATLSVKRIPLPDGWNCGDVCVDWASRYVYAIGDRRVYRVDPQSQTCSVVSELSDSASGRYEEIAIYGTDWLFLRFWNDGTQTRSIIRMTASGDRLGELTPPISDIRGVSAGKNGELFLSADFYGVFSVDQTTGQTLRQIYWDGFSYQNIDLSGGPPVHGSRGSNAIFYNPHQDLLLVNFGEYPNFVSAFDPLSATPQGFGNADDFRTNWEDRISMDDSGDIYVSDRRLNLIQNTTTGTVVYSERPDPGEYLRVDDMTPLPGSRILALDSSTTNLTSLDTGTGVFRSIPVLDQGSLPFDWARSVAADADSFFCAAGCGTVLRYDSAGSFLDGMSGMPGSPLRMVALEDGRLLVWVDLWPSGRAFYTYRVSDGSWAEEGPFLQVDPFQSAESLHLCQVPDGRILYAVWDRYTSSFGTLAQDLSGHTGIWSSANETLFQEGPEDGNRYRIDGIAPAPGTDVWIALSYLSAMVRFNASGQVFASLSLRPDAPGWTPLEIAAYSRDTRGDWRWSEMGGLVQDPADGSICVFDNGQRQFRKFSPETALPR